MVKSVLTVFAITLSSLCMANQGGSSIDFTATPGSAKIDLVWVNPSQEEVVSYVVERSKDGELWGEILTVRAGSSGSTAEKFIESDFNPIKGTSYYRLKKVLQSGLYAYSNIVVVKNHITPDDNTYSIPLNEKDFSGFCNDEVLIVLRDGKGDMHFSKVYVIDQTNNLIGLDLEEHLLPGNYVVTASSFESLVSLPLVVK